MVRCTPWSFVEERLAGGGRVALLVVVDAVGATPGRPGFKMAVAPDGALDGTIGGGEMERALVEEARAWLRQSSHAAPRLIRQVHDLAAVRDNSGMICGGEQEVALVLLRDHDRDVVRALHDARDGTLCLSSEGLRYEVDGGPSGFERTGDGWSYRERIGGQVTVYIAGGGHVSLALSRLLAELDFRIVVFDDRADVSTMLANTCADEKHVVPFDRVGEFIPDGIDRYVVIMTPSHRADEVVLAQVVKCPLGYIGMMASQAKATQVLEHLRAAGVSEAHLARVRAPIGLPIRSQTPAEIAVSIAAELILTRASSS